jgi:PBSX family phage portal protein
MAKRPKAQVRIIKAQDIKKAQTSGALDPAAAKNADVWITQPVDVRGLAVMKKNSSILPQCIRAYKNNIAGFGLGIKYKEDIKETPEMKAEWTKISEVLALLNMDMDTKEVFEDIIEARETYGISYLEVIRNVAGEVIGIDFIKDTPSVQKTVALMPFVEVEYIINGRIEKRPKKFVKYRQQIGASTVYFKEIGDPRPMDNRTGEYAETVPLEYQANEILAFSIGTEAYGEVRWMGQVLGIDGSRKAENLNNRYFSEGRHTPLMIMIKGGTLTDDSFTKLQEYVNGVKGEAGQHAFIVLEAANTDSRTDMEGESKPEIEIKDLASMLQRDELFQEYLDNNRRRVQSAFQLPDLYVGYMMDFNRATAQTAQEITEEQVFQPERASLAWAVNNKLLAGYRFKYVEAFFKAPKITNPDDLMKILNVTERAGGLTPNKAKEIALGLYGETSEDYDGDWGNIPLAYARYMPAANLTDTGLDVQLSRQVAKAAKNGDEEIAAVLKEIRALLTKGAEL